MFVALAQAQQHDAHIVCLGLFEVEFGQPPEFRRPLFVFRVDIRQQPQQRRILGAGTADEPEAGIPVLRIRSGAVLGPIVFGEQGGEVGEDREHERALVVFEAEDDIIPPCVDGCHRSVGS